MKNCIYIFLLLFFLFSCRNRNDLVYSCNPQIDQIVHLKNAEFQLLNLDAFLSMNLEMQRAIYRSYSSIKRYELWKEKLKRVINSREWEGIKLNHIITLNEFLSQEYFENVYAFTELPHKQSFARNWLIDSQTSCNMNNVELSFLISSLFYDYNKFLADLKILVTPNNPTGPCSCNVLSDFCSTPGENKICRYNECILSEGGCGWLWLEACNGQCIPIE